MARTIGRENIVFDNSGSNLRGMNIHQSRKVMAELDETLRRRLCVRFVELFGEDTDTEEMAKCLNRAEPEKTTSPLHYTAVGWDTEDVLELTASPLWSGDELVVPQPKRSWECPPTPPLAKILLSSTPEVCDPPVKTSKESMVESRVDVDPAARLQRHGYNLSKWSKG
ncbi:uncharacterized protein LOC119674166 [Teleopsis dalmanni]|uniref:uncharacterized protein LOC119674166 n=1 Tax=Teleopsis dalmanni TaxID=139649 RepID=UPI0018CF0214|nr:uncharacterized protein LOC119674166 [Teleopsis dalmanni]